MHSAYIVGSVGHMLQILDLDRLCVRNCIHTQIFSVMVQTQSAITGSIELTHAMLLVALVFNVVEVFVSTRYGSHALYAFTTASGNLEN